MFRGVLRWLGSLVVAGALAVSAPAQEPPTQDKPEKVEHRPPAFEYALTFLGIITFLPETDQNAGAKLDWFGFGTLSLAIGALQVLLDRGEQLDWFGSGEIWMRAVAR